MSTHLELYVAAITEHVAGCDCQRCREATEAALATFGHRVILDMFGKNPIALTGAVADTDVTILSERKLSRPWTADERELTRRERRVAELICSGMARGDVAMLMEMSPKTFDTHRSHVMRKMKVANEVQLVRLAVLSGWVQL